MPDLRESLQGRDLGYLRIIAELWGIDIPAGDARMVLQHLIPDLLNRDLLRQVLDDLPDAARIALKDLLDNGGKQAWSLFSRRHGKIREMGPGRRDRERPYLQSPSAAEDLWYRGIISRAFFDGKTGMEEYTYIPEDLLTIVPASSSLVKAQFGRPASQKQKAFHMPASDWILDDACTYLAAQRMGFLGDIEPFLVGSNKYGFSVTALQALLMAAGLIDRQGQLVPEPVRDFLEAERNKALLMLVGPWKSSMSMNELRLVPGLSIEGETLNDPLRARQALLDFLALIPEDTLWNTASFIKAIHQEQPDFQRPAGDYDSWFIKDTASGVFLRGFEHWESVEGAWLRFMLCGLMHWLGLTDLAAATDSMTAPADAFCISPMGRQFLVDQAPAGMRLEDQPVFARTDGVLQISRYCPRSARYQLARFCRWDKFDGENYRYQFTTQSLSQAAQQGLKISHVLVLLRKYAGTVPPNLVRALERWEQRGVEARIQQEVILKLSSPDILQALRNSPAARLLGEPLGPTAVVVKPGAVKKVLSMLAEMGYLGEADATIPGTK